MKLLLLRKYMEEDSTRLALWAPVLLGLGIGLYFALPRMPGAWFLPSVLFGAIALAALAFWVRSYRWPVFAALLLMLGLGLADATTRYNGTAMLARDTGVRLVTGVVRDIEPRSNGARLVFDTVSIEKLSPERTPKQVRLTYRLKDAPPPAIGTTVSCLAKLMAISPPVLPGGYDFRRHNYFEHIGATGFVVRACELVATAPSTRKATTVMADARVHLRERIGGVLQSDEAAIAEALLTGVQQGISDETMTAMRISGLVHILSVSGLHIGLAAGIVFFMLRALLALIPYVALRWPIKKIAAVAAMASALAYTLLVGAPIPAVRSLLMIWLVLLAVILDRQALSLRVVAVAAIAVLVLYPASVLSPSFQMSFAAVTAIIALVEGTEKWQRNWLVEKGFTARALVFVGALIITSVAATLATLPFTYYHFQQLNVYGVLANLLAMPLASLWLMPLVVVTFIAVPLGLDCLPLLLLGEGVRWLMAIADGVASLPGADWRVPYLPDSALILMVLGGLWIALWQARWRWLGLAPIAVAVVMGLTVQLPQALVSDDGKIAMLRDASGEYVLVSDKKLRADNFVIEQWQRYLGLRNVALAADNPMCSKAICKTADVVLIRDPNAMASWCRYTDKLLILPTASAGKDCGRTVDTWDLYRSGAVVVNGTGHVKTVADDVGDWPWSRFKPTTD